MATAIKKIATTEGMFTYVTNVSPGNYPISDWELNPDISDVSSISTNYWKYDGTNIVVEMTTLEKDAVDAALLTVNSVNIDPLAYFYTFIETFSANEVKTITLPTKLKETYITVLDPAVLELTNKTLLSAAGSGPVGWDPGNKSTLKDAINDGNYLNYVYNNSVIGNVSGYIKGIDMLAPTDINFMEFWDYSAAYYNSAWEFIGTDDATAATYDVIFSETQNEAYLASTSSFSKGFNTQTYRYYGIRCVKPANTNYSIQTEMELSTGTLITVEKELINNVDFKSLKLNDTTVEVTNLSSSEKTFKIVVIGKE